MGSRACGRPTGSAPFAGPFPAAVALGFREVSAKEPATRAVHCLRIGSEAPEPDSSEALCTGSLQQSQIGTAALQIAAPSKPARAFVGGSAKVGFPLEYAGTSATPPTFALGATTTAKGAKFTPIPSFIPGTPNPSTHQSPAATENVTLSVPKNIKPGTYDVTLTATAPQGGTVSQTGKLKVAMPTLKLGAAKPNPAKGTAMLSGKGVAKAKKKTGKAKTLKVKIAATGKAKALLASSGKAKVKIKATFKPKSGISVSKTKSIVLKLG
jgi:hypothetical protein